MPDPTRTYRAYVTMRHPLGVLTVSTGHATWQEAHDAAQEFLHDWHHEDGASYPGPRWGVDAPRPGAIIEPIPGPDRYEVLMRLHARRCLEVVLRGVTAGASGPGLPVPMAAALEVAGASVAGEVAHTVTVDDLVHADGLVLAMCWYRAAGGKALVDRDAVRQALADHPLEVAP